MRTTPATHAALIVMVHIIGVSSYANCAYSLLPLGIHCAPTGQELQGRSCGAYLTVDADTRKQKQRFDLTLYTMKYHLGLQA